MRGCTVGRKVNFVQPSSFRSLTRAVHSAFFRRKMITANNTTAKTMQTMRTVDVSTCLSFHGVTPYTSYR